MIKKEVQYHIDKVTIQDSERSSITVECNMTGGFSPIRDLFKMEPDLVETYFPFMFQAKVGKATSIFESILVEATVSEMRAFAQSILSMCDYLLPEED